MPAKAAKTFVSILGAGRDGTKRAAKLKEKKDGYDQIRKLEIHQGR
jgi:hypothetical protein